MNQKAKDLDGAAKNLDKFKKEITRMRIEMTPHIARFLKTPFDGHSFVNLFVEACRISPYLIGHIDALMYPLFMALMIYVIVN